MDCGVNVDIPWNHLHSLDWQVFRCKAQHLGLEPLTCLLVSWKISVDRQAQNSSFPVSPAMKPRQAAKRYLRFRSNSQHKKRWSRNKKPRRGKVLDIEVFIWTCLFRYKNRDFRGIFLLFFFILEDGLDKPKWRRRSWGAHSLQVKESRCFVNYGQIRPFHVNCFLPRYSSAK